MNRTALRHVVVAASWLGLLEALGVLGFGLWLAGSDASDHGDEFDGLGVAIGLAMAVPALVVVALLATAARTARRRPVLAGVCAALVGLPCLLALGVSVADGNVWLPGVGLALTGVVLLVSGMALALVREPAAASSLGG